MPRASGIPPESRKDNQMNTSYREIDRQTDEYCQHVTSRVVDFVDAISEHTRCLEPAVTVCPKCDEAIADTSSFHTSFSPVHASLLPVHQARGSFRVGLCGQHSDNIHYRHNQLHTSQPSDEMEPRSNQPTIRETYVRAVDLLGL